MVGLRAPFDLCDWAEGRLLASCCPRGGASKEPWRVREERKASCCWRWEEPYEAFEPEGEAGMP